MEDIGLFLEFEYFLTSLLLKTSSVHLKSLLGFFDMGDISSCGFEVPQISLI